MIRVKAIILISFLVFLPVDLFSQGIFLDKGQTGFGVYGVREYAETGHRGFGAGIGFSYKTIIDLYAHLVKSDVDFPLTVEISIYLLKERDTSVPYTLGFFFSYQNTTCGGKDITSIGLLNSFEFPFSKVISLRLIAIPTLNFQRRFSFFKSSYGDGLGICGKLPLSIKINKNMSLAVIPYVKYVYKSTSGGLKLAFIRSI